MAPVGAAGDLGDVVAWLSEGDPLAEAAVVDKARAMLLDTLGCIVAALARPTVRAFGHALAGAFPGPLALPGSDVGLGPAGMAALGATAACWDEACEGLASAHGRPALPVVPTCLALATARGADLRTLLGALVVGYEVGARAGQVWSIRPGMHVDGTWHALGATAAAARLLELDGARTMHAIEAAGCQIPFSLYLPIAAGDTARNTYPAHAALLGLLSAEAAAAGITAPAGALSTARTLALAPTDPGERAAPGVWLILDAYFKPFAAVRHVHYAAAAALALRARLGGDTRRVRGIRLETYPEALRYCGIRAPRTPIQAQFSLSYGLAAALALGDLGPDAYGPALTDPEIRRLEALVEVAVDPALESSGVRSARVALQTERGGLAAEADAVPGDPERPLDLAQVVEKFVRYAAPVLGGDPTRELVALVLEAPLGSPARRLVRVAAGAHDAAPAS